jgi:zinc protease
MWYRAGSKDELKSRRGTAHMFEHMMFQGSERVRPGMHTRHIDRLGGYVDATTTEDATRFVDVVPKDYLDFACRLEAERMRRLLFRPAMIDSERAVVKAELRQQEGNLLARGFLRLFAAAFTAHPYGWTAAGVAGDLDAITPAELESFYNAYYVPNNAMLVVVGDVTRAEVEQAVSAWFGPIPRGPEPPRPAAALAEPPQTAMRREVTAAANVGLVLVGYHIPGAKHADIPALQVVSLLLGSGDSSRLHGRLVRKENIAVQATAPMIVREHPGLLAALAVHLDAQQSARVEAALIDEIAKLAAAPVSAGELAKAIRQLQSAFALGLEEVEGIARQIGNSWVTTGDPGHWLRTFAAYQAVTAADVRRVATTYLRKDNLTVVVIPPMGTTQN